MGAQIAPAQRMARSGEESPQFLVCKRGPFKSIFKLLLGYPCALVSKRERDRERERGKKIKKERNLSRRERERDRDRDRERKKKNIYIYMYLFREMHNHALERAP